MTNPPKLPSELTTAADALAHVVAQLLSPDADPQLVHDFRLALGNLLAATLGGATAMAAGTVVVLNDKLDRLGAVRAERLREVQHDLDRLAVRVHALEDALLDDGVVGQLAQALYQLAQELEQLKATPDGDG